MLVPVGMEQRDTAHAAFNKPPCEQAIHRKRGLAGCDTIHIKRVLTFMRDIDELGCALLHAKGHFVVTDSSCRLVIVCLVQTHLIQLVDRLNCPRLLVSRYALEADSD